MHSLFQFMYDFFDALITQQTSPEEAYRKFDDLSNRTAEALRKITKQVQEAKSMGQDAQASKLCSEYDETLARYASNQNILILNFIVVPQNIKLQKSKLIAHLNFQQVHPGADGSSQDFLGQRKLSASREDIP